MKKVFITLITASLSLISMGHSDFLPIDSSAHKFVISEIVEASQSQENLFKNAKTWVVNNFEDYENVIQFEDKKAGS